MYLFKLWKKPKTFQAHQPQLLLACAKQKARLLKPVDKDQTETDFFGDGFPKETNQTESASKAFSDKLYFYALQHQLFPLHVHCAALAGRRAAPALSHPLAPPGVTSSLLPLLVLYYYSTTTLLLI